MAFNTVQALLSTVLTDKHLAFVALALIYGAFSSFTIVAPKIVSVLGPQLAMVLGAVPYVVLVFVNIDPSPSWAPWGALLLPASAAVGVGAAILWTGQGIYMSRCAIREATLTGESVDSVTGRLNGYFWTAFQFNGAVGTLIAGVLRTVSLGRQNLRFAFLRYTARFAFLRFTSLRFISLRSPPPPPHLHSITFLCGNSSSLSVPWDVQASVSYLLSRMHPLLKVTAARHQPSTSAMLMNWQVSSH